jgi:membrane protease YdiL (CAAX protease family)
MRLFLLSLFVFIMMKVTGKKQKNAAMVWIAIILVSIIFGLGHLPITAAVTAITPWIIFRAILLNGIGGVVFGWLYWKKGLESAVIAHFWQDIVLHVFVWGLFRVRKSSKNEKM